MVAKFWVRDDDAWTVSVGLERLCALARRHKLNVGLAVVPAKLDRSLISFLGVETAHFYPMCHGWKHVNYGREGRPAEFGRDRPISELRNDGRLAFQSFSGHFPNAEAVFVPPFGRVTNEMVGELPRLGFVGVSKKGRPCSNADCLARSLV